MLMKLTPDVFAHTFSTATNQSLETNFTPALHFPQRKRLTYITNFFFLWHIHSSHTLMLILHTFFRVLLFDLCWRTSLNNDHLSATVSKFLTIIESKSFQKSHFLVVIIVKFDSPNPSKLKICNVMEFSLVLGLVTLIGLPPIPRSRNWFETWSACKDDASFFPIRLFRSNDCAASSPQYRKSKFILD